MPGDGIAMAFDALFDFEKALAEFTGAPYVVVTDGCTHAIELCMRYHGVKKTRFTAFTYLSIPQLMRQLDIEHDLIGEEWHGEYQFYDTCIWDSARRLESNMYRSGQRQCVSFGFDKPLALGKGGAVLLDDHHEWEVLSRWRADGRDLRISPWQQQVRFGPGWHYCPTLELCRQGLALLSGFSGACQTAKYPDCRQIVLES
jgi:dTDP-4-amino-4,6-dideoxygalactose transaminase